jgi:DNA-binding response OmpR family regulator
MREADILLVEGKSAGGDSLQQALSRSQHRFRTVNTGAAALAWIKEGNSVDLVVLDASTMRSSGVRTCRRLRLALEDRPIILCRTYRQGADRSAGADVYLNRPFSARKLLNRIRALLPADKMEEEIVCAGSITAYLSKGSIEIHGQGERRVTPKLLALFREFLLHPNTILPRHDLMKRVWKTSYFGDTRTLDVHIRWLREVIEQDPANPIFIKTVRGVGYIFAVPLERD